MNFGVFSNFSLLTYTFKFIFVDGRGKNIAIFLRIQKICLPLI